MKVVVTLPPYADFLERVVMHPLVCGVRVNTVMPYRHSPQEMLRRYQGLDVPVWVDLKGRQLRVKGAAVPPFTCVQLSHPISVPTPCLASFGSGRECHRVMAVEGDRIFLEDGPRRLVGPGESVNILHPQLRVHGYLTDQDKQFLEAMSNLGWRRVMLSFVEKPSDLAEVRELLPQAEIVAKLESAAGLDALNWLSEVPMVARGDLLVELGCPVATLDACQRVIRRRPEAWVGSRILNGLVGRGIELSEVMDVALLGQLGYTTLLLGDELCLREDSILEALDWLEQLRGLQVQPDRPLTTV
ncbi:hypothetical protein IV102_01000 [bacterium]|nr:hypothetical protein [bacterium]